MDKAEHCIICNLNSTKYFYAFLLPIFCMLLHFFQEIIYKETDNLTLKYNLPLLFYYFLPKLFSIILMLIRNAKAKGESNTKENTIVLRRYHFTITTEHRKKILLLIYVISLLEVIYKIDDLLLYYLYKIEKTKLLIEKRTGFIIFVPLFSYYILKKKLYKHHLLALFILLIGEIIILVTLLILNYSSFKDWKYHIINIFFSSFFSLSLVLIKYIMVKYVIISPYNFLMYDGIFCIINLLLCTLFEYFIVKNISDNDKESNFFEKNYKEIIFIFKDKTWKFFLSFFIFFFSSFGYFICNVLTIFHFTPYLNVLTDFLTPCLLNILYFFCFEDKSEDNIVIRFIFQIIGFILIILGALILNEIIILNFCGLNENTYSNISNRGKLDSEAMEELTPNVDNDDVDDDNNDNNNDNIKDNININDDAVEEDKETV